MVCTPRFDAEGDDVAHVLLRQQDVALGDGLAHLLDVVDGGHLGRAVDVDGGAIVQLDLVDHGRRSGDEIQIVFTLQTLLDDLHVQHPEEAAAEAEAQRRGALRFVEQGGVVEGELLQRIAEGLVVIAGDGEQARIDLGFHLLETGQRLLGTVLGQGQGIPTGAPWMSLMPQTTQPTSPQPRPSVSTCFGVKIPMRSTPHT